MTNQQAAELRNACEKFLDGWSHFLDHIDFNHSNLDAEAIRFMNEVPGQIETAVRNSLRP